jgi:hypothetical protein
MAWRTTVLAGRAGGLALGGLLTLSCASTRPQTAAVVPGAAGWSRVTPRDLPVSVDLPEPITEESSSSDGVPMVWYSGKSGETVFSLALIRLPEATTEEGQEKARAAAVWRIEHELLAGYSSTGSEPLSLFGYGGVKLWSRKFMRKSTKGRGTIQVEFIGPYAVAQVTRFELASVRDVVSLNNSEHAWDDDRNVTAFFKGFNESQAPDGLAKLKASYPPLKLSFTTSPTPDGWFTVNVPEAAVTVQMPGKVWATPSYNRSGRRLWRLNGVAAGDPNSFCRLIYSKDRAVSLEEVSQMVDAEQTEAQDIPNIKEDPKQPATVGGRPAFDVLRHLPTGSELLSRTIQGPNQVLRIQAREGTTQPAGPTVRRCLDTVQFLTAL